MFGFMGILMTPNQYQTTQMMNMHMRVNISYTSSNAQVDKAVTGGGSFKDRSSIGKVELLECR